MRFSVVKIFGILSVALVLMILLFCKQLVAESEVSTVIVEASGSGEELNREEARVRALREAYVMSLEKALSVAVAGETPLERLKRVLHLVFAEKKGYVKSYEVVSSEFSSKDYHLVLKAQVQKDGITPNQREALRIVTELVGKPKVLVIIDEANLGKHVTRSVAESQINRNLSLIGYTVVDNRVDVLDKLMDRKKQLEDKKLLERRERTFSPEGVERTATESISYTVDYYNLVIGYGNEKTAYDYAKEKGADILILGGVYTEEVDIASALPSATKSNFHSVRAYSTIRAVVLDGESIVTSEALEVTKMDLSPTTAGNEAIKDLAERIVKDIIMNIPLEVKL